MVAYEITHGHQHYPAVLHERLGRGAPHILYALGDSEILRQQLLGFICSIQCPGSIIIRTLDLTRTLRDAEVPVIGGFHSPMEHECLDILLRGEQPVVRCVAQGMSSLNFETQTQAAIDQGRLLIVSPFDDTVEFATAVEAMQRNDIVAALATDLWVPHASPNGKAWSTVRAALERQQRVFTFDDESNRGLLEAGAAATSELLIPRFECGLKCGGHPQ